MPDQPDDSRQRRRQSITATEAGGAPSELTLRVLRDKSAGEDAGLSLRREGPSGSRGGEHQQPDQARLGE